MVAEGGRARACQVAIPAWRLCCYGVGVPKDEVEAVKWYRKAAEQGNGCAQEELGRMYYSGQGVPKNFIESYAWYLLAKANGQEKASEAVSSLEEILTAEQIKKGQERAAELRRLYGKRP